MLITCLSVLGSTSIFCEKAKLKAKKNIKIIETNKVFSSFKIFNPTSL